MESDDRAYAGREQTRVKHTFLRHYLQKLTYKIGWNARGPLNYVDCFAGPWKSSTEDLSDTSPFIAMEELRKARAGLEAKNRPIFPIRCLFIESDPDAFSLLVEKLQSVEDLEVRAIQGKFEDQIQAVAELAAGGFTFLFIDPTGWSGYGLDALRPLLELRSVEILINFMTKDISRFIDSENQRDAESFRRLFGDLSFRENWAGLRELDREDAIVETYCQRLRVAGDFQFVVAAPILNPIKDRSHFHLIYATRSIHGLRAFRNDASRPARHKESQIRSQRRTHDQGVLFPELIGAGYAQKLKERYWKRARTSLEVALNRRARLSFDELEVLALAQPLVCTKDLKIWLEELRTQGTVRFDGLAPRARVPQADQGHFIVLLQQI